MGAYAAGSTSGSESVTFELFEVAGEDVFRVAIEGVAVSSTTPEGAHCADWAEEEAEAHEYDAVDPVKKIPAAAAA